LGLGVPFELDILLEEAGDERRYTGVAIDEAPIKICETKKDLDVVLRLGSRPICNGCDAFGIHCNAF